MTIDNLTKKSLELAKKCGISDHINVYISGIDGDVLIYFNDCEYYGDTLEGILLEAIHDFEELEKELKEGEKC